MFFSRDMHRTITKVIIYGRIGILLKCTFTIDDSWRHKNKYIFSMYIYAVLNYPVKAVTHKFLIKEHSQNEGDNVHSVIERQVKKSLKSGPIYHPSQYISLIRTAKKNGNPYKVYELSHSDFF